LCDMSAIQMGVALPLSQRAGCLIEGTFKQTK
jgi:hypothetical protein